MEIKYNKYVVYSVIVILVALVAFNFEKITGYAGKTEMPAKITITNLKPGDILTNRMVARLEVENSFPNQRIKVFGKSLDRFTGHSLETENCKTIGSSREYDCEADLYVTDYGLRDGEIYYFQALDRRGRPEGNPAMFTFKAS